MRRRSVKLTLMYRRGRGKTVAIETQAEYSSLQTHHDHSGPCAAPICIVNCPVARCLAHGDHMRPRNRTGRVTTNLTLCLAPESPLRSELQSRRTDNLESFLIRIYLTPQASGLLFDIPPTYSGWTKATIHAHFMRIRHNTATTSRSYFSANLA